MSEIKQTNFRIDQESADAFRAYCEESGLTQAQGFDHLLHVLELNRAKTEVPGRLTEISDFENHLKCILATYVQSIALAENTESRVRSDYDEHISIKEEQILALEDELRYAQYSISACNATEMQLKALQDDLDRAHADLQEAEKVRHLLEEQHCTREADKQRIIDMLTTNLAIAEEKATSYDTLLADHDRLANELQRALDAAKEQARIYEHDLESAARTAERTLDAALSAEKDNCAVLVSQHKEELLSVKIKAAEDLRIADEQAHERERSILTELRAVEKELAVTQQELAIFRERYAYQA